MCFLLLVTDADPFCDPEGRLAVTESAPAQSPAYRSRHSGKCYRVKEPQRGVQRVGTAMAPHVPPWAKRQGFVPALKKYEGSQ